MDELLKPGEPNHCRFCGSPYGDIHRMAYEIKRLRTALEEIEKLTAPQVTLHYHCKQTNVIANLALAGSQDSASAEQK